MATLQTTQSTSYTSGIQVQNLSSTQANAQIVYYDQNGSQVSSQPFTIPPNGSYTIFGNTMTAPAGFVGSAVISADQPIQAISNILGSSPTTGEAYDGVSNTATTVNIPLFQQANNGFNTSLYIQNASGTSNSVTVKFNQNGVQVSQKVFALAANGSITVDASNDGITTRFVGSAIVTAQQPVAVTANQTNGSILFSYTGAGAGSPTIYAPLIMTNNSGWTTGFQVQNAGTQATTVSLYLNGGSSPVTTANLNPGQSVTWYPVPGTTSGTKFVGSATVQSSNGQPLLGAVNELNSTYGQGMTYSAFASGTQTVDMPLIMYNNSGYYTGEQIQNVGTIPATVDFKVNGTVVDTKVIQPGASYTWFGTNLIPGGGKVASAQAVARETGAQIVGIVNEVTSPQQPGDTSFAYEGFSQ
jgi:hypothetical protein